MNLRLPLDSVVVLPHRCGVALNDAWSELAAEDIAARLARIATLRVIPNERVRSLIDEGEFSPEEIGRRLNAAAAVVCAASAALPSVDFEVELIDVIAEATMARQTFLSSVSTVSRLPVEVSKTLARWLTRSELPRFDDERIDDIADIAAIRACMRTSQYREALALCRRADLRCASATLRCEIARVIVDAPSSMLTSRDVELAKRSIAGMTTDDADELAGRIACRFDLLWQRAAHCFARACTNSQSSDVHASYALFLIAMRRFDDARRHIAWIASRRQRYLESLLAALINGDSELAMSAIRAAFDHHDDDPYATAQALAANGDRVAAIAAMKRAIAAWSPFVMLAWVDPAFEHLRKTRRFRALLRMA